MTQDDEDNRTFAADIVGLRLPKIIRAARMLEEGRLRRLRHGVDPGDHGKMRLQKVTDRQRRWLSGGAPRDCGNDHDRNSIWD